jgi:signal transduction histidine kinase
MPYLTITEYTKLKQELASSQQTELQQRHLSQALRQAGAALNSTLNYQEVLDRILEQMSYVVLHNSSNIMLIEGELVRVHRWRNYEWFGAEGYADSISFKLANVALFRKMQQNHQPIVIPYVASDPEWVYYKEEHRWIQSYAAAPIQSRGQVMGFLNVNSATPGFYREADAERLQAFADQAALALENARLFEAERQRRQEAENLRDHLEELVNERTIALSQANTQLNAQLVERNKLIAELDAFAHTVAHDLRAPIGLICNYTELLQNDWPTLSEAEINEFLGITRRIGRKSLNIIEELLLLAGVRKGGAKIARLDMAHIVAEVVQRLTDMQAEYQAEIILPEQWPTAVGYAPWVEEIWINYLSNALKYGGSPPCVKLGAAIQADQMIRFWVHDNGGGLSQTEQEALFTPFTRLNQLRVEGHGLGLSIVQRIVDKLGGEVGVESQGITGQGSIFWFTLPGYDWGEPAG